MGDIAFHAKSSAEKFGGVPEDYVPIHKFLDQSKLYIADWRHRAVLHNTFGIKLSEDFFGDLLTNADGEQVSVRTVASQHIIEDLRVIPTPADFLREMPIRRWMNGLTHGERRRMQSMTIGKEDHGTERVATILREALQEAGIALKEETLEELSACVFQAAKNA